ncbi:hypothetical protein [Gulosibacter hominis]|nr:hypothetical protein [Gulosibacter hominis]
MTIMPFDSEPGSADIPRRVRLGMRYRSTALDKRLNRRAPSLAPPIR